MQINSLALSRMLLHHCSGHAQSSAAMQNLFKQQQNSSQLSHKVQASQEQVVCCSRRSDQLPCLVKLKRIHCKNMPGYRAFFVPAVSENLLCRICHLPVRNAVQVSVCGHRFCDSCLNGAFSNTR